MDAAIPNLDFIRQLIEQARMPQPQMDAERIRMAMGSGVGTDSMTAKQEDR